MSEKTLRPLKDYEMFLAFAVESHIWHGLLTAADVFAEIPLAKVIETYGDQAPDRRVDVISSASRLPQKVVQNLSLEVQQTVLEVWYKTNDPDDPDKPLKIFLAIGADDLVRFTDQKKIVAILKACREIAAKDPGKESGARENVAVMIDKLVEHKLLGDTTVFEIYEAIGFDHFAGLDPAILAATLKYLAYRNMRKMEKHLSPRIDVKDFYVKLNANALATLDLTLVEEVFKAFETKYDLVDEDVRTTGIPPAFAHQADEDLPVIPRLSEIPQGLVAAEGKGSSETPSIEMTDEEVVDTSDQEVPALDELVANSRVAKP